MSRPRVHRWGFTLVEVMLVITVVACLAVIAIPNFVRLQCKAKQSEGRLLHRAVMTAETSYEAEHGTYLLSVAALTTTGGLAPETLNHARYYWMYPYLNGWGLPNVPAGTPVIALFDCKQNLSPVSVTSAWCDGSGGASYSDAFLSAVYASDPWHFWDACAH